MATIKSYTTIEQSHKLAEILPLESADMKILPFTEREYRIVPINDIAVCGREDEIYTWSLSALLSVLPIPSLHQTKDGSWYCNAEPNRLYFSKYCDNPVDACVNMIEKLYELNLL